MKYCFSVFAIIMMAQLAYSQDYAPFLTVEPPDMLSLHRDSERWIRERFRWYREQRLDPDGNIPEGVREQAWTETQAMSLYKPRVRMAKDGALSGGSWVQLGPVNIGGRITGIAIHPVDPDIVYFTAADGGVWKSVNGTSPSASFVPVSDDLPTLAMGSIDLDPNNPDLIYVGTGEANGSSDSYPGLGVARSTDAGLTWKMVGGSVMKNIGAIRVHKTQGNIINAASRQGIHQSLDSGKTWKQTRQGIAHDLVSHPTIDSIIFAGVQGQGVLKSTNGGTSWVELDIGLKRDSIGRIALDLCLTQPNIIYAVIVHAKGPNVNRTYAIVKSIDGGVSWERTTPVANPINFFSSYGWYNCEIAVHPTNPSKVLVGGVAQYLSLDGCRTFSVISGVHVDQHAIEYSPTAPDICYLGNDGGMYISDDGGSKFRSLNDNLPITQFYEMGLAAQDPSLMMGGTQDNGSNTRHQANNDWQHTTGGDGGYCVFDYTDLNYRYAEYQNGSHLRSTNGGRNWLSANKGLIGAGPWVTPVVIHPTNPKILFTCTNKQLYKTTNRAESWFPFHGNMDSTRVISCIAVSPKHPDLMLVGYIGGNIYKTTNAGAYWVLISKGTPGRNVTDMIFDPVHDSTFYASFAGYISESVFKTTDGGQSWSSISGNLPAIPTNALEINPHNPDELYAGTDFGVYATTNGGTVWQILGEGMPKVVVVDLDLHPISGQLVAATHGRSAYGLTVTTSVELLAFSASRMGNGVDLIWRTGSTAAIRGFAVERSVNDQEWQETGYIESSPSVAIREYHYGDNELPAYSVFVRYRLKQLKNDGTIEYSPVLHIDLAVNPEVFTLEQNYPNPFNPGTTIRYHLPRSGVVNLYVTDVRGKLIGTLHNGPQYANTHIVHFNAQDLPAGVYFYHLEFEGKRRTKTMMLMK